MMRIGLIAPNYYPVQGGNAVTVRRIAARLQELGCRIEVFSIDQLTSEQLYDQVKRFRPELLHAFHAHRGGMVAHALACELELPYLITLTGTDVYEALADQRGHDTRVALRGAARIVAFHPSVRKRLGEHLPTLEERFVVIPQGVELPELRQPAVADGALFLLPAGLRPVKNVLFPLKALADLQVSHPDLRLIMVGPVLDADYAAEVLDAVEASSFAQYLGGVRHEEMEPLYRAADVVLNTSLFEGGMANSVLEGMSYAKPILASDIEGNRSVVKHEVTGLLYHDADAFKAEALRLLADPRLREMLGRKGRRLVETEHTPEKEARSYLDLYQQVLATLPS